MLGCSVALGPVVLGMTFNNVHELFTSYHSAGINKTNQTRFVYSCLMRVVIGLGGIDSRSIPSLILKELNCSI